MRYPMLFLLSRHPRYCLSGQWSGACPYNAADCAARLLPAAQRPVLAIAMKQPAKRRQKKMASESKQGP